MLQKTVLQYCASRADSWARKVKAQLQYLQDLVAKEVVYHVVWYSNFRSGYSIPKMFQDEEPPGKKTCPGRPKDTTRLEAFECVVQYLQNADNDQITMSDLVEIMNDNLSETGLEAYTTQYMKTKLIERFSDEIIFAQSQGHADIVSLKRTASTILRDFFKEPKCGDLEEEKLLVIQAASDLIYSDIKDMSCSKDVYPDTAAIEDHMNSIPQTLRTFLQRIFKRKDVELKVSATGRTSNSAVYAAIPSSCSPQDWTSCTGSCIGHSGLGS